MAALATRREVVSCMVYSDLYFTLPPKERLELVLALADELESVTAFPPVHYEAQVIQHP